MLKSSTIALFAGIIIAGIAGFFIGRFTIAVEAAPSNVTVANCQDVRELRQGEGFKYINPLLECDNYQPSTVNSVTDMENHVKACIDKVQHENKVSFVSVYFRDLNFGPWMGINEKEDFSPASLLKVPIMIAAFKKEEKEPGFLKKKVAYLAHLEKNVVPNITDGNLVKIGSYYTIEDLVNRMVEHSDNEAKELLLQNIDGNFILQVMADIGANTNGDLNADFISVKEYSGFFRLLYNATYLNRELSEKALTILSKTSYDKGIMAGLPKGTKVSHKFGERAYANSENRQLHECGIVYVGGSPYLICIMTRGTNFDQMASAIAEISGIVYKDVTGAKPTVGP